MRPKTEAFRKMIQERASRRLGAEFAKATESGAGRRAEEDRDSRNSFGTMRLKTLQVLYATPMAYAYFGYEGEAFSKGGYVLRGFNDLRWLPEVPPEDSGPMPM